MVQIRTAEDLEVGEFLAQYGVLGMKWGVRKDERAARKLAKREERAKKFDTRASINAKNIATAKKRMQGENWLQKMYSKDEIKKNEKERKHNLADAKRVREGKLTRGQKTALITTGVGVGAVLAGVTAHHLQSGEFNRLAMKGKAFLQGQKFEFKQNEVLKQAGLSSDEIQKLVVDKINPDFGKIGANMNCRRATFAYELRRRGLDVAATKTTTASGQNVAGFLNATTPGRETNSGIGGIFVDVFKETVNNGPKPLTDMSQKVAAGGFSKSKPSMIGILKDLAQQPNGARGEVAVRWASGGGHSMAYEIVNNIPTIFDAQTGQRYTLKALDNLNEIVVNANGSESLLPSIIDSGISRLDNVELNLDYLMKWVKNAV